MQYIVYNIFVAILSCTIKENPSLCHMSVLKYDYLSSGNGWCCSANCEQELTGEVVQDYVRNYAVATLWYGLVDIVHRDFIREGDGHAMMAMWRLNMPRYWMGNNYKYMIIAHRLLAGKVNKTFLCSMNIY